MPDGADPQGIKNPASAVEVRQAWIRALAEVQRMATDPGLTLAGMLDALAAEHGDRPALLGEGESFTYRELAARTNRIARWAVADGLAGQAVALLMPNRPEYVAIWLGLTRAGCAVALINTNLAGDALAHSLKAAQPRRVIVADSLAPALTAIADRSHAGGAIEWQRFNDAVARFDDTPLSTTECTTPAQKDLALFIYTSGTTGAPKAARITHGRVIEWALWFAGMMDAGPDDRLYDCLPLYHSTGGVVAIGAMLVKGGSVLIRARFSATRFWDDVVDGGCTVFQYIGEICRYLAASPAHRRERQHKLRLACGNGLQGAVWTPFAARFGVPRILEFYAATEGSVSLYNVEGKPGAIGRVPPFLAKRFPVALVRCDANSGAPLRDAVGRCIPCGPDEIGEALGKVVADTEAPARQFDGYTDGAATARKLIRDAFAPGDRWFRTGDLMRKDAAGFFYFIDRIGDTFRWKGENVATAEVAEIIAEFPGVTEATVYGVSVPGAEGAAGMATIVAGGALDLTALRTHLVSRLPAYARPLFLRIKDRIEITATFKHKKNELAREGYDPAA
ncbi:MAG: long-chain-acyl-CoA synthetase, partial [Stellaceae bacterium]